MKKKKKNKHTSTKHPHEPTPTNPPPPNMATNKQMIPPINCIFNYLQTQSPVIIWLYEQTHYRIHGQIRGFDEFMNLVVDDAIQVPVDGTSGKEDINLGMALGRILLKGDNITLITSVDE